MYAIDPINNFIWTKGLKPTRYVYSSNGWRCFNDILDLYGGAKINQIGLKLGV
jgi:hypothetical protein